MKNQIFVLLLTFAVTQTVYSQKTITIPWKGMYVIQDSGTKILGDCVFCFPENMPDRIILDSTRKMIARRTSNPFGFTYYEWKNKEYTKTYQEIQLPCFNFKSASNFTDSGSFSPKEKNTFINDFISYYRTPYNKKEPYNGLWTAEKVQIQLKQHATDSMVNRYQFLKDSIRHGAHLWTEINFYENGKIKSMGTIMFPGSGALKKNDSKPHSAYRYKIGLWLYYDFKGRQYKKDNIQKPIKID
jgi:hypothetical protein